MILRNIEYSHQHLSGKDTKFDTSLMNNRVNDRTETYENLLLIDLEEQFPSITPAIDLPGNLR